MEERDCEPCMSRRELLAGIAAGTVAAALPLAEGAEAAPAKAHWVEVGKGTEFTATPKLVKAAGHPVFIVRDAKHHLHAISGKCTHRGCTVGWEASAHKFHCPCHGAEFSEAGKVEHGPAQKPLPVVQVHEMHGKVSVNIAGLM